jgi:hypothetical protein
MRRVASIPLMMTGGPLNSVSAIALSTYVT